MIFDIEENDTRCIELHNYYYLWHMKLKLCKNYYNFLLGHQINVKYY